MSKTKDAVAKEVSLTLVFSSEAERFTFISAWRLWCRDRHHSNADEALGAFEAVQLDGVNVSEVPACGCCWHYREYDCWTGECESPMVCTQCPGGDDDDDDDDDVAEGQEAEAEEDEDEESTAMEVADINAFADREGWGIYNGCEIQRDDESKTFETDDDAFEHVCRLAAAGSALHKEALRHVAASGGDDEAEAECDVCASPTCGRCPDCIEKMREPIRNDPEGARG